MRGSRSDFSPFGGADGKKIVRLYLRILPARISYLKFILEGYDNLAVLSTTDAAAGLVRLQVFYARFGELMAVLAALSPDLTPWPAGECDEKSTSVQQFDLTDS